MEMILLPSITLETIVVGSQRAKRRVYLVAVFITRESDASFHQERREPGTCSDTLEDLFGGIL
jgi:hypothetical protein